MEREGTTEGEKPRRKVLLIGWDAADWKMIHPMVDAGKMPALEGMMNEGVCGNLATLQPVLSPMLWTSIATGKRAFKHGIYGFSEPDPASGGIRPITNLSRKTKAIWNILNQEGKQSSVIGWWPSHPVEPLNGVMVSNHFQRASAPLGEPWPMAAGTVHPKRLESALKKLRFHPSELEYQHLAPFVPQCAKIDHKKDPRVGTLAKIVADCTSIQGAATAVIQNEEWDFMAVYFDAIDHFGHAFMKYHPPRSPWVSEEDFELYKDVVEGGYLYHDMMLDTLLKLAGDDTTVILMSDHGFHPDHLRLQNIPMEPAGPAAEHREFGVLVAKGPGIKKDARIYGASLLDICPTILSCFGLPVGEDMDGKPLLDLFESRPKIESIPSWDSRDPKNGCTTGGHPEGTSIDPLEAKEAIDQLVALGYIEEPGENQSEAVANTVRELDYNLARSYMDGGRYHDAEQILSRLWAKWPEEHRFGMQLAHCFQAYGKSHTHLLRPLAEKLIESRKAQAVQARQELKELKKKSETKSEDNPGLSKDESRSRKRLQVLANPNFSSLDKMLASVDWTEGKGDDALERLQSSEKEHDRTPALPNLRGRILLDLHRWDEARSAFELALERDNENAPALLGLARAYLGMRKNRLAAEEALNSIALLFHNPKAHFVLGTACFRMKDYQRAAESFEVAVRQNPTYAAAHSRLAVLYSRYLRNSLKGEHYARQAQVARERLAKFRRNPKESNSADEGHLRNLKPRMAAMPLIKNQAADPKIPLAETTVIVSGLPRSGTSMMMQMLEAGGIEILADDHRPSDESNLKGYLEFEKAKSLKSDQSWLPQATGKAFKLVAQLLPYLPRNTGENLPGDSRSRYRVIFMQRPFEEVIASQTRMLARQGKQSDGADLSKEKLSAVFAQQIERVAAMLEKNGIPTLVVGYHDAVKDPVSTAASVNHFLSGRLDEGLMAGAVDPQLHRERESLE